MSKEIEIEFKNLVSFEDFHKITNEFSLSNAHFKEQKNYYFDTPDFSLKNQHSALRVRQKGTDYEFTLKQPAIEGLIETTDVISEHDFKLMIENNRIPKGEVYQELQKLNLALQDITFFGVLTTRRAERNYLDGILVFDISSYLKKIDYEIEYEVNDRKKGEDVFLSLMKKFNIPIQKTDNKIVRFYKEKLSLQQDRKE